ncbi:hypothetical protein [Streptomyces anandii]|uniref:hypothetical protein n=1 Tax=Streptomyces anandii TaxID=285454 RepID=UPI0037B0B4E8
MPRKMLPSGNWVELRDPTTLLRGDKKKVLQGMPETDSMMKIGFAIVEGLLQILIVGWSYDLPLPSQTPESLDLIPMGDDEELTEAVEDARKLLFPDKPEATEEQLQEPTSPTAPSAG